MGDVVIELVLEDAGVIPARVGATIAVFVTIFSDDMMKESLEAAARIASGWYQTVVYPDADKMGKQFKLADKLAIPLAVIIGPDELSNDKVA